MPRWRSTLAALLVALVSALPSPAQDDLVPHGQDRPPNDPRGPEEAAAAMTVPEGFTVEVVAAEPDLVNPVAMTIDEKGRFWVTESLEYPRREPGPGRDRVKVLEDTDGDGKADKFTIFAEGLNIPSGIAVGRGGVWVANSPDILFYPNADGDLEPDGPPVVVVSGFGRDDTHELPNSLTWGPDGWLYGWNGVFNFSHVEYRGKTYDFTCAIFRIHPETRDFELFCEGTSNPWGIAIDPDGSFFASACVIDHLWHLVETGYYHRQGGPYPPFTWKIESIVDHFHQKRAYCGIHYFDSDAYPPEFRDKLYMGNIHGNCINVDSLTRDGATYRGREEPDFLSANDAWFMPVVQKTGPDGCLYVLDWYDRYHCYQDANRDPEGIDRLKGRLYRVRYRETPRRSGFDLAKASDDALIELLRSPNVYDRDVAQRLLTERLIAGDRGGLREKVRANVLSDAVGRKGRMHALWALVGSGPLDPGFHLALLAHDDPAFRAWGVRAAGNMGRVSEEVRRAVRRTATDEAPAVRLQFAIAARKVEGIEPMGTLLDVLGHTEGDPMLPRVVWQNLHPQLGTPEAVGRFAHLLRGADQLWSASLGEVVPRALERSIAVAGAEAGAIADLAEMAVGGPVPVEDESIWQGFDVLIDQIRQGRMAGDRLEVLRDRLRPLAEASLADPEAPFRPGFARLAALWGDPDALAIVRDRFADPEVDEGDRREALDVLVATGDPGVLDAIAAVLVDPEAGSAEFRGDVLGGLGRMESPRVAEVVLASYDRLAPETRPRAVELLTQRPSWTKALLGAIGRDEVPSNALNVTQVRSLLESPDEELVALVRSAWGTVREGRDPAREQMIDRMRSTLAEAHGDPYAGRAVFTRVCGQCHKVYGEGQEVGPDLTGNGRGSYDQLLSNVFDPSLVIGASYQATIVATADGRILTGLLEEDSDRRVVLKLQGGEREVIPRDQVDAMKVSAVSLMPENLEEQVTPVEMRDLFAFLCLDRAPEDAEARPIEGTPRGLIAPSASAGGR